jgi:hypothetical protein
MKKRLAVVAAVLSGAVLWLAAAPAMARADVSLNIGIPGVYVQPAPVYVQEPPVYVRSRPTYGSPRHYREREYRRQWRDDRGPRHHRGHMSHRRDRDGDGVPNRYDSRPNNPYRD